MRAIYVLAQASTSHGSLSGIIQVRREQRDCGPMSLLTSAKVEHGGVVSSQESAGMQGLAEAPWCAWPPALPLALQWLAIIRRALNGRPLALPFTAIGGITVHRE